MNIKRMAVAVALILALAGMANAQSWWKSEAFMAAGVSCGAGATIVNQTGFGSGIVRVSYTGRPSVGCITVTFTRTTGTASLVDFEFQASYDNGTTWTTAAYVTVSVATNALASSNVVYYSVPVYVYGVSHLRLSRIVNNDGSTALTVCNAYFSF